MPRFKIATCTIHDPFLGVSQDLHDKTLHVAPLSVAAGLPDIEKGCEACYTVQFANSSLMTATCRLAGVAVESGR